VLAFKGKTISQWISFSFLIP